MVASQSGVQEPHNDMYCSAIPNPYGEYYPDYYIPPHHLHHAHQQELCPQPHGPMCTLHTDYCPVTVPMVSTNSSPPIAMPVQVPPGHVVQQIVDESGTLRHVILSPQPPIVPIPPPHGHNQQHYVPGPGNGSNQPPQPYFAQGLPPGYPHFSLPPSHLGHGPPPGSQHPGHSPPPPPSAANFHKDERTQRQYIKLKRKLEQKQLRVGSTATGRTGGNAAAHSMLATTASPRRDTLVNGLRRGGGGGNGNARHERGMSSVGTSEDGEESSSVQDDDDDANIIVEILSSVQAPQVSDLSSRSALIQWSIPPRLPEASNNDYEISEADLRYEVLLSSDKGKEGKYKSIYNGSSLSCRIQDLKPGQEYSVCLQVHMDELQGSPSELLVFKTPPCEPDQPQPPKLISRNRTSLQLRWNAATDNGSHILHYILEFDEGKGGEFVELSKGKGKQNNLQKLQSSTCYKFRLAAVNEFGKSAYSDIVAFSTSGSPPAQPTAPTLKEASVTSLHLTWQKRPNDDDFTLQMDDGLSRHGFLPVFNGKETEYVCEGLRRASEFKFRLKAHNEEGPSRWSEEVCFRTLPDRPSRPHKLGVKGKIHAHQFRVKWDPPNDDGGSDITAYILEIDSGAGYAKAYVGNDTETTCDRLIPGTTYRLRVYCASDGGESDRSEPCVVTTEPVCPGKCRPPRIIGRPKADSMTVTWSAPDFDGGSPITEYELDLIEQDRSRRPAYRGLETECLVDRLKPGTPYTFVVRASNRTGVGAWSEEIVAVSGAAAPDAPLAPEVSAKSPFHVHVRWREPNCNGAAVSEYRLEIGSGGIRDESFSPIFQGGSTGYEVKGLAPATAYFFRVQACNAAGCGAYSPVTATVTPPSAPSVVLLPKYESTPTSITLMWSTPSDNGSEILHYNIEIGDKSISTETVLNEFSLRNLHPDTVYKIKIQAVNSVGNGPFSPVLRAVTPPLPPAPPKLECVNVGHNYIKLKWGEGKNPDFTRYCVEMDNPRAKEFQCVYVGTSYTCKVNKLQELTEYRFRISAANDAAGQGDVSTVHVFKTSIAPPAGLRAPKVIDVGQKSCSLEWGPCKITSGDPIVYSVQMTRVRDQDFKQVYRGSETKCTVSDLEAGAEYSARVCPIRLAQSGELRGAHSPVCNFTTAPADLASTGRRTSTTCLPTMNGSPARGRRNRRFLSWLPCMGTDDRQSSDRQKAILILIGFASFAILAAVLVEQFIIWRQSV